MFFNVKTMLRMRQSKVQAVTNITYFGERVKMDYHVPFTDREWQVLDYIGLHSLTHNILTQTHNTHTHRHIHTLAQVYKNSRFT